MHTLSSVKQATTSWGKSEGRKVAIKVCYVKSQENGRSFTHLLYGRSQIVLSLAPSLCMHGTLLSMECKKRESNNTDNMKRQTSRHAGWRMKPAPPNRK